MSIKDGKYIVSSSTGLVVKGTFKKMNAILTLSSSDLESSEIKKHIEDGFLRFMGPKESQPNPEMLDGGPIKPVSLEPKDMQEQKPQSKKKKPKKDKGETDGGSQDPNT